MSYTQERLENLSKEDLIKLLTKNYETFEEEIFNVQTKIIYDKATDKIVDFSIIGDLRYEGFSEITKSKREVEDLVFLESLRRSGITNMMASGKYLAQIGGRKNSVSMFMTKYETLDDIEKNIEKYYLDNVKDIEKNKKLMEEESEYNYGLS